MREAWRTLDRKGNIFMKMRTTTEKFLCLTCLVLCGMAEQSRAQDVACLGQIVPGERVLKIAAPPEAIIGELRVKRGMRVNAGDSLAILREHSLYAAKRSEAALHLETARIDLSLVKAGERREAIVAQEAVIAACRAETDLAKVRLNRYASLLKGGHVEQDRYDDFASQSVSLNARLRREESVLAGMRSGRAEEIAKAELAVKTADVALTAAQAALDLQTIHAPCAGEIVEISAWPGESVGDAGTLLSLAETDRMTVLAEVYEKDLARVKTGQRARERSRHSLRMHGRSRRDPACLRSEPRFSDGPDRLCGPSHRGGAHPSGKSRRARALQSSPRHDQN